MNTSPCCEKCGNDQGEDARFCRFDDCPCHTVKASSPPVESSPLKKAYNAVLENAASMNNQRIFQPVESSWESRFDAKFCRDYIPSGEMKYIELRGSEVSSLKSFISKLLAEREADIRGKLREVIKSVWVAKPDREEEMAAYRFKCNVVEETKARLLDQLTALGKESDTKI